MSPMLGKKAIKTAKCQQPRYTKFSNFVGPCAHPFIPRSRPAPSDFTAFPVSTFCAGDTYNGVGRDTVECECIDKPVLSNGTNKLFLFQRDNGEVVRMSNKNAQFLPPPYPSPAAARKHGATPNLARWEEVHTIVTRLKFVRIRLICSFAARGRW